MTKYEILSDANKVWDKTLAHFTELFSLRKVYCNDRAANSRFESAVHVRDHSSARIIITANTESDLTRDLYIESLEESLVAAREQYTLDATTRIPILPAFDPLTLLHTELVEQRKQVSEVMAQNAKLIATLSKGGGNHGGGGGKGKGKGKGGNGDNGNWHNHGKINNSAQTATRRSSMILRIVSLSRQTRPNAPRDEAPNTETDRDRGLKITIQHYENGLVKINPKIYQYLLRCAIFGPHWLARRARQPTPTIEPLLVDPTNTPPPTCHICPVIPSRQQG
jgi:hypothetical protein